MSKHKQRRYRDHAEEARVLAERMVDPILRQQMLTVADDYERYAASAAELESLSEERVPSRS
jgi:hypothetical protein